MNEARIRNDEGIALFHEKRFQEAARVFQEAIDLLPVEHRDQRFGFDLQLNLANSYQMVGDYDNAKLLYDQLILKDPDNRARYEMELNNLLNRMQDEVVRNQLQRNSSDIVSPVEVHGDDRLSRLIKEIIINFPAIRLPITAHFVDQAQNTEAGIEALGSSGFHVPISQGSRGMKGHILVYNYEFWINANDSELRGNLAHELMHREWEDTGLERHFFVWDANSRNYSCLEWIMDLCTVAKGLEEDLYNSKKYILERVDKDSHLKADISMPLLDIKTILSKASNFEMPGRADKIPKYDLPAGLL